MTAKLRASQSSTDLLPSGSQFPNLYCVDHIFQNCVMPAPRGRQLPPLAEIFKANNVTEDEISEAALVRSLRHLASRHRIPVSDEKIAEMAEAMAQDLSVEKVNGNAYPPEVISQEPKPVAPVQSAPLPAKAVQIPVKRKSPQQPRRSLKMTWRCYKRQIIWLIIYFTLMVFLFGMGCLQYINHVPTSGRPFNAASMVAIGFGMTLQFNCGIFLFGPALRWTTSFLRNTWVAKFVPFDSWIGFHIVVATTVCVTVAGHVICMLLYFYGFSLSPAAAEFGVTFTMMISQSGVVGSDYLGFTAISGWVAVASLVLIVIFALPVLRKTTLYDVFYWTHKLQLVFWAALIVHTADFWKFLIIPLACYLLEKLHKYINAFRWSATSHIKEVNLLPGDVTNLVIKRPRGFDYNPGDYCFIKAPSLGILSWHPFTLSSSPEQTESIWFHTKASGNYTKNVRRFFSEYAEIHGAFQRPGLSAPIATIDSAKDAFELRTSTKTSLTSIQKADIPVYLDGPYASSGAELFHTEHAVLIGAGIGVTPFMSILGSLRAQFRRTHSATCPNCDHHYPTVAASEPMRINGRRLKLKKVDFIWIIRDPENLEWIVDILSGWDVLQADLAPSAQFLTYQIYVTAVKPDSAEKMLTHSPLRTAIKPGRPNWPSIFEELDNKRTGKMRVFYCGPHAMEDTIRDFCGQYRHDFSWENF